MLEYILLLLNFWGFAGASWEYSHSAAQTGDKSGQDASKPYIYYCRSPSMETFTCWWHPLETSLQGDHNVTYSLMYTIGNSPPMECPDYVTGGPNSCFFDTEHTMVWEVFCLHVTAHTSRGTVTSDQHCLDVAEIVEIDPPFNLTYSLMNISEDESGHTVLVSWQYPIAQQVNVGWITLIYELRFRAVSRPNNWKVKERLREPRLELLNLQTGSYEVQVRCRSKNNHLWSKWSSPLTIVIPPRGLPDHVWYTVILVSSIGVTVLLIIGFGVIPQSKRIKAFLLPPIPKPCIRGIDPMLLKMGKMDEINRHFASLYGYIAPQYHVESLLQVSVNEDLSSSPLIPTSSIKEEKPQTIQNPVSPKHQQVHHTPDSLSPYCHGPSYCREEALEVTPGSHPSAWAEEMPTQPELVSFPGIDYSMILPPTLVPVTSPPTCPDFYTCVHGVTAREVVHLVACASTPLKASHYFRLREKPEEEAKKSSQFAALLERQGELLVSPNDTSQEQKEQSEYAVPLQTEAKPCAYTIYASTFCSGLEN